MGASHFHPPLQPLQLLPQQVQLVLQPGGIIDGLERVEAGPEGVEVVEHIGPGASWGAGRSREGGVGGSERVQVGEHVGAF